MHPSKWGVGARAVRDDTDDKFVKDNDVGGAKLFNTDVAAALGYGKNFTATYQWWITLVALLVAVGGYITWMVGLFKAAEETDKAFAALRLKSDWWTTGRQLMILTAVVYPVFALLSTIVSGWRALLAKALGGVVVVAGGSEVAGSGLARWRRRSKRWQAASLVSSVLLWLLVFFLLFSFAGLCVWAASTVAISSIGEFAVSPIATTWERLVGIATQSQGLVDDFVNSLARLPAIGRRRVLSEVNRIVAAGGDGLTVPLPRAGATDELSAAIAAGVAAQRSLQQLPDLSAGLNTLLQGAQTAISSARKAAAPVSNAVGNITAAINSTGLLPNILPSGSDNPLFKAVSTLRDRVGKDIFNSTGCPVYCIDMRDIKVLEDGCLCNMDRVRAALPFFKTASQSFVPAIVGAMLMWAGASWLLLHAASMWGRTRTEGRLLQQSQGHHAQAAAAAAAAAVSAQLQPAAHTV